MPRFTGRRAFSSVRITCSRRIAISRTRSTAGRGMRPLTPGVSPGSRSTSIWRSRASSDCAAAPGVMPDGGLFDFPGECPSPPPIAVPETAAGQFVWLTMPARADNTREVSRRAGGKRRALHRRRRDGDRTPPRICAIEEEIEVAYPRLAYEIRKTAEPGLREASGRADCRGARPNAGVRRKIRAAGPRLRRASDG